MQEQELKIQHLIILSALFVTLLGSLLLLEKINERTQISGSTTMVIIDKQNAPEPEQDTEETDIRIVKKVNLTASS